MTSPTTRDIALAIRDGLEHLTHVTAYRDDEHGDEQPIARWQIFDVDASHPGVVLIELVNGQRFTISVAEDAS